MTPALSISLDELAIALYPAIIIFAAINVIINAADGDVEPDERALAEFIHIHGWKKADEKV